MQTLAITSKARRWPRYVLLALAVLVVLVGAVVGVASWLLLDDDRLRTALEKGVTTLTDRPFHVDGDIAISFGRVTTVSGSDIRWLNPAWSKQPNMLTARRLSLAIDLWSLVRGPIVIADVQADDAKLSFEWSAAGQFNWSMGTGKPDPRSSPVRLVLAQTALRKVEINVSHPGMTGELLVDVLQASQRQDAEDMLVISTDAVIDERPLKLQGRIGPFAELIAGGAIDYDFVLAGPDVSVKASGHLDRLVDPKAPRFDLELAAADASAILQILELPPLTKGAIDLQAQLAPAVPATDGLDGVLKGNFGEFKVDARLKTRDLSSLDDSSVLLHSTGPGIGVFGQLIGVNDLPDKPYSLQLDASRKAQELQLKQLSFVSEGLSVEASGVAHKFPEPRDLELDVAAEAENLHAIGKLFSLAYLPALPLSVKASVKSDAAGGKDELRGYFSLGNVAGEVSGQLSRKKDLDGSTFRYHASTPDLRELAGARGIEVVAAGRVPARLEAELAVLPEQLRITRLTAKIADDQLRATGLLDFRQAETRVELEPQLTGPDLARLVALLLGPKQAGYVPVGPYAVNGTVSLQGSRLQITAEKAQAGGSVFGFDGSIGLGGRTATVDARITATGSNLADVLRPEILKGVPAAAFSLSTTLKVSDRGMALNDLQFSLAEGRLSGRLASGWPRQPERVDFDLVAAGSNLRASLPEIPGYVAAPVAFRVEAKGTADETSVNVERLDGKLADARIELAGKIAFKPAFSAAAVRVSLKGPKLSDLGRLKDWPLDDLPFALSASMSGGADRVKMEGFQATLGGSDLNGSMSINTTAKPQIDLNVRSNYLDLRPLFAQPQDKASESRSKGKSSKLFSSQPLPLEVLKTFNGKLQGSLAKVEARQQQLHDVQADASLQDGVLVVKQLKGQAREGKVAASFTLDTRAAQAALNGRFAATDVSFSVRGTAREQEARLPHHRIDSHFSSTGNSIAALAAGLDGYFWLRSSPGQFLALDLGVLFGDFAVQLFSTLNPFAKKEPYSTLTCGGAYLEARNGRVETAPAVVLQTEKLSIVAKGSVDLHSEKINAVFKVVPLEGVGLSASNLINSFIKLGGTLQEPALDLDVTNAAVESGVAAATMGLSIVAGSLWDRWIGSSGACARIEKEARELRQTKAPGDVPGS